MEHEGDRDANYRQCTWNGPRRICKGTVRLENKTTNEDHQDYTIKIGLNTEKSPYNHSNSSEKPSADVKNSQRDEIIRQYKYYLFIHDTETSLTKLHVFIVYYFTILNFQKVRLKVHRKAVVRGEIEKSGMADHIWKEKGNHLPLWDEVKIFDSAEHWRIRLLKESAHVLGYNDLLNRPSIEMNTIWEPIIKKVR